MKHGYVLKNEAAVVTENDLMFVYAPCRIVEDAFGRCDALPGDYYVASDGNCVTVLTEVPTAQHAVWYDGPLSEAVFNGCFWPYDNVKSASSYGECSMLADSLFEVAIIGALLFDAASDSTAWADITERNF